MSAVVAERCIGASHPSLAGHFPGQPVVPGVVLLDEVLAIVRERDPHFRVSAFPAVKFMSPLLPDEPFSVRLEAADNGFRFECRTGDRVLAKGSLRSSKAAA